MFAVRTALGFSLSFKLVSCMFTEYSYLRLYPKRRIECISTCNLSRHGGRKELLKVFEYECGVYVPSFAAFNFWRRDEIRGRASEVKRRFSAEPQLAMLITGLDRHTCTTSLLSLFTTSDSIYLTHSNPWTSLVSPQSFRSSRDSFAHATRTMPSATGQNWEKYQKTFADDEVEEKKITPLTDEYGSDEPRGYFVTAGLS